MTGIIDLYYDDPVWCPACGDTGEIEDDEGFVSDCHCIPENDEPWLIPARDAQGRRTATRMPDPVS